MPYLDPKPFWRSDAALRRAREGAIVFARRAMRERARAADALVFEEAHGGRYHLEFFRSEFPQIVEGLPKGFRAFELGAGLGWLAFLLAAGGGRVFATELEWRGGGPYQLPNCYTMYRMAEKEPSLREVLDFHFDETKTLRAMTPKVAVSFARASAHDLPLADASVDLHYSMNCLEHISCLRRTFEEAARVLRLGGICFHTTEPLYFSPYGHHLGEFFPLPWGHLLWEGEELAELAVKEAGPEAQWLPGEPLRREHLLGEVFPSLTGALPADVRAALRPGPWEILGWVDVEEGNVRGLAQEIGLSEAVGGVPEEALFLRGLKIKLARREKAVGLRLPMKLGHLWRRRMRNIFRR